MADMPGVRSMFVKIEAFDAEPLNWPIDSIVSPEKYVPGGEAEVANVIDTACASGANAPMASVITTAVTAPKGL